MGSDRSVRVAGPASLAELERAVRENLGLAGGAPRDPAWSTTNMSFCQDPVAGYEYVVTLDSGHPPGSLADRLVDLDRQARQVFYGLASSTDWALCMLDHVGEPRAERAAVVRTPPRETRPLDAGPRPISSERSVRVSGPTSLAELVEPVRRILRTQGAPEPPEGDSWSAAGVSVRRDPADGYDYVVTLDGGNPTGPQARRLVDLDWQARQVYYGLVATTRWAVCLLDHVGDPRVERPAIVTAR